MGSKETQFFRHVGELGIEVEKRKNFNWLQNRVTPSDGELWQIFLALNGDVNGMQKKCSRRLTPDGYLPEYNCMIEFDELQHFTDFRCRTFEHYPVEVGLGFDADAYRKWCCQYADDAINKGPSGYRKSKPEFCFTGGRAAQRALFDACRDLLPHQNGLNPTIRVSEFQVPSLLDNDEKAIAEIRIALRFYLNVEGAL